MSLQPRSLPAAKRSWVSLPAWLLITLVFAAPARISSTEIRFELVRQEEVRRRLESYKGDDRQRAKTLKKFFEEAGCTSGKLTEQPVQQLKEPNLICSVPGATDSVIVVGAHFDHVDHGNGVVDNWSGASLLPSLFEVLKQEERKHTFILIGFAGEEKGLVGSESYAKELSPEHIAKIQAMVNMDTLGLGPAEVWVSRSDPKLLVLLSKLAQAMKLPVKGMNVEQVGKSDEQSFIRRKVPTITFHPMTQATLHILHSPRDQLSAIKFEDYYSTYRLLTAYLIFLDQTLEPGARRVQKVDRARFLSHRRPRQSQSLTLTNRDM